MPDSVVFLSGKEELILALGEPYVSFAPPAEVTMVREGWLSSLTSFSTQLKNLTASHTCSVLLGSNDTQGYFGEQIKTYFPQLTHALLRSDRMGFQACCGMLAGLGDGSTPTGDDLIHGALIALHYYRRSKNCKYRAMPYPEDIKQRTTPLGAHMLEMGQRGLTPEPVRDYVLSLLRGRPCNQALQKLSRMGGSTGHNIAVGAFLMLAKLCGQHNGTQ
ncbi:MAG: DUF2877 domain-containing protein [Bacillota bacterium]